MVAEEAVGFRFEADLFESVPMTYALVAIGNVEIFRDKKMVAAENVGFGSEASLFKSVPMILGFCSHEQH